MRRSRTIFTLCSMLTIGLVACNSDGRTLRPASPSQNQSVYTPSTTTTTPETTIPQPGLGTVAPLNTVTTPTTLVSTGGQTSTLPFVLSLPWADGGTIDTRYTCNGEGVHPQISWLGAPDAAVEMALVVTDADLNDVVHWVIAGLDPHNPLIGEGDVPVGAIEGQNGFSDSANPTFGWKPPCPPSGTTHHYWFTLYALDQQVDLPTGASAADMQAVIEASSIDAAEVTGIYTAP